MGVNPVAGSPENCIGTIPAHQCRMMEVRHPGKQLDACGATVAGMIPAANGECKEIFDCRGTTGSVRCSGF